MSTMSTQENAESFLKLRIEKRLNNKKIGLLFNIGEERVRQVLHDFYDPVPKRSPKPQKIYKCEHCSVDFQLNRWKKRRFCSGRCLSASMRVHNFLKEDETVRTLTPERKREYNVLRTKTNRTKNPEPTKRAVRKFSKNNPEKVKAWGIVAYQRKKGNIIKPNNCEVCNIKDSALEKGLHAHHDDYSKPLEIIWLCPLCHVSRHKELNSV